MGRRRRGGIVRRSLIEIFLHSSNNLIRHSEWQDRKSIHDGHDGRLPRIRSLLIQARPYDPVFLRSANLVPSAAFRSEVDYDPGAAVANWRRTTAAADDRIIHSDGRGGAKYAPWRKKGENRQFSTILRNETAAVGSFTSEWATI